MPPLPEPNVPTYPQVTVQLTGTDGNVFSIIGRVAKALRRHIGPGAETEFTNAAFACGSYDDVLILVMRTVDVT
jgi:hypothetical protein